MKVTPILDQDNFHNETSLRPVFINNKGHIFNKYDTEKYTIETLDAIECGLKPVFINKSGIIVDKNETETYAIETLNAIERGEYYKMLFNMDVYSNPNNSNENNKDTDKNKNNNIYSYMVYAMDIVNQMLF